VWGVGTKLVTAYNQPALGGVYKLSAIREKAGEPFRHVVKLSEQIAKISTPGVQQVRRYHDPRDGHLVADAIIDEDSPPKGAVTVVDVQDPLRHKALDADLPWEPLLEPVFRAGARVYSVPDATAARARTLEQLQRLPPFSRRLQNPHEYPVGLEQGLSERRLALVKAAKEGTRS
jgi:nicotinate phosphoribosyltransferase